MDIRQIIRFMTKEVPSTINEIEGCKKEKNIERYFDRTAGMFYVFRSCGIRLGNYEMYVAESVSDVLTFLIDMFGSNPASSLIEGVAYDRSCDLHPFIVRLAANGNQIARNYLRLAYMVDIWHVGKHKEPTCVFGNPECEYHPRLEKFSHVMG